jgi:hypothetical protein
MAPTCGARRFGLSALGRYVSRVFVVLPLLLAVPAAQAGGVESKEKAAKKACISGDYAKGVSILSDLYVDTNDITYIFNQGRCFEQNGRYADALNRFREYARKLKDAGKTPDAAVVRHIADCQALIEKEEPQPAETTPPTAPSPATPPVAEQPAPPVAPASLPPQPEPAVTAEVAGTTPDLTQPALPAPRRGAGLRIAGIATLAVGVAGLATGVILNVKANQLADEMDASNTSYSRSKESTRGSYETFGWVGYGVGAACVAGGAILYILGHIQGRSSQAALLPTAGPGQLGAVVQGAF